MLDQDGYRPNVGIVLLNKSKLVFWGRRKGEASWQFPQGGLSTNETLDQCMFRELNEEVGLLPEHVTIMAKTNGWLYYNVPGYRTRHKYRGQKQVWYLLKFIGQDYQINVRNSCEQEFDAWRWISYWDPVNLVVKFKQDVYKRALTYLANYL